MVRTFMLGCTYIALQRRDSNVPFFAPILGLKHHQTPNLNTVNEGITIRNGRSFERPIRVSCSSAFSVSSSTAGCSCRAWLV
jgi:hypothetical protein